MTKSRGINRRKAIWTPELDQVLRDRYPNTLTKELAQLLGLSPGQVYSRAGTLKLTKTQEFLRLMGGQLDGVRGTQTRFKPGNKSWSTGRKGIRLSRATEFKKGRKPEEARNYCPIGTLRLSKDGYLEQKVSDDLSVYPAKRWKFVHRLVWEKANGPIPNDYVVAFKKGQFTNKVDELTVDRVECISRSENAKRNNQWAKDPEMMRLYQLKGQINRQINRIKEAA